MAVGSLTFNLSAVVSLGSVSNFKNMTASLGQVSVWTARDITVSPNVYNQAAEMGFISNARAVLMATPQPLRANFGAVGNTSYVSAASAGFAFDLFFAWVTSAVSGTNAI